LGDAARSGKGAVGVEGVEGRERTSGLRRLYRTNVSTRVLKVADMGVEVVYLAKT
jgi:hypothetical protein